jgi:hypothetical protein
MWNGILKFQERRENNDVRQRPAKISRRHRRRKGHAARRLFLRRHMTSWHKLPRYSLPDDRNSANTVGHCHFTGSCKVIRYGVFSLICFFLRKRLVPLSELNRTTPGTILLVGADPFLEYLEASAT